MFVFNGHSKLEPTVRHLGIKVDEETTFSHLSDTLCKGSPSNRLAV